MDFILRTFYFERTLLARKKPLVYSLFNNYNDEQDIDTYMGHSKNGISRSKGEVSDLIRNNAHNTFG